MMAVRTSCVLRKWQNGVANPLTHLTTKGALLLFVMCAAISHVTLC